MKTIQKEIEEILSSKENKAYRRIELLSLFKRLTEDVIGKKEDEKRSTAYFKGYYNGRNNLHHEQRERLRELLK